MTPQQHTHIEFIKNCLRNGEDRKTILQKFTKLYNGLSVKTFDNRLKVAYEAIQKEFKKIESKSDKGIDKEIESRTMRVMTVVERIDILARMAYGELEREETLVSDGKAITVKTTPTFNDRRGAIAELNKMGGDYAPIKNEIVNSEIKIKITTKK